MKKILNLLFIVLLMSYIPSCKEDTLIINSSSTPNNSASMLLIDLKGAIRIPNVYSVEEGTLLIELINLAGGLEANADVSNINLALVLCENQMITIPYKQSHNDTNNTNLININKASVSELCTIPGIGTAKANNIINYRNNNGYFITIEDIKKVNGIGEELFNKIKTYICV